ncbi:MAG: hypothetical protein P4L34_11290 [Paludibacter sp.]|nr:hypothetical protein [Paludibacter sp.]
MKRLKVLLDFIKLIIAEKISFYRNVIAKLTDNATFPTPDVSLADAKTSVDKLEASYIASKDGSHTAIAMLHANEAATDELFRTLAAYVERMAGGDESKILSAGFHVSKQPTSFQKPDLAVLDGPNSGSVKLVAKAVDKAGSYIWQMVKGTLPADEKGWITLGYTTQANNEMDGLEVAAIYYFRVAAITPDGTTDFCSPVMKVVV